MGRGRGRRAGEREGGIDKRGKNREEGDRTDKKRKVRRERNTQRGKEREDERRKGKVGEEGCNNSKIAWTTRERKGKISGRSD